jgi:hypothetical protein
MPGRIGYTRCGTCGNPEATVDETPTGTVKTGCHKCGFTGYAKAGSKAKRLILAAMTPEVDDTAPKTAPQAAPVPSPTPTPQPTPKRAAGTLLG